MFFNLATGETLLALRVLKLGLLGHLCKLLGLDIPQVDISGIQTQIHCSLVSIDRSVKVPSLFADHCQVELETNDTKTWGSKVSKRG